MSINSVSSSTRDAVRQALLNSHLYGSDPSKVVTNFQATHSDLKRDGIVGSKTLAAFHTDGFTESPRTKATTSSTHTTATGKPELAPRSMTPQQKFDYYSKMVKDHGGTMDPNKPTVLGLRGLSSDGTHHKSHINHNVDDTFVVLDPKKHTATEVSGITHPAQATLSGRPTALLDPGNYKVVPHANHNGDKSWQVFKQNGGEVKGTQTNGVDRQMTGVLFHRGINGGVSSAGCQSFPQASWDKFTSALGRNTQNFNYTLLDAQ